jgi:beta-N-acetylhexosaminidase
VEVVVSLRRLALGTLLGAFDGPVTPDWVRDLTAAGIAGFALFGSNVDGDDQLASLCASIHAIRPDVLIAIDEEGGDVTRLWHRDGSPYPGNAALGAIDDPALTTAIYASIGADLARVGIDLNLAPTVDVNTRAENPVIGTRSFGADPHLVARHAAAAVAGLSDAGVAACAKHFPGHGATLTDSHLELPRIDATRDVLTARDLPPFVAAMAAGCGAIMTAHIRIPALTGDAPATFSPAALALLQDFAGVIITDALEMRGAVAFAGSPEAGAVLALAAGADLLCIGAAVTPEIVERIVAAVTAAVDDGRLPLARLEEASSRVARLARWVAANRRDTAPAGARSRAEANAGPALGLVAARRAVAIEGILPDLSQALIVHLEAATTMAEGRVPMGVLPHVRPGIRTTTVVASAANPAELSAAAGQHPIVIAGRNLHRLSGATTLIESMIESHVVVVLEMGWPSAWRPKCTFVMTRGASLANSIAAAEALKLTRPERSTIMERSGG